jgi:ATP-dependent DNA helicase DinG
VTPLAPDRLSDGEVRVGGARLPEKARATITREIAGAGGREVSFVARLDAAGSIVDARAVARGTVAAVLALPGVARRGEMLLHNHPSGILEPSQADLSVAAQLHDDGIGFGIVNNDATDLYVVVEVPRARSYQSLDAVHTAQLLAPDSPVAEALGLFEDRPSQRDMAAYVADAFNDPGVSLLEAGTGVGKSFAYLVPALEWARVNDERTIVSTNTINLQEQLVGKDLPVLARAFTTGDRTPSFALLKGWRNYLCLSRLHFAGAGQTTLLEPEREEELDTLVRWAEHTKDGSLADLTDPPSPEVWDEVSAEPDLCTRVECPYFDGCFVFAARRRAADADVVVVNHHLLAADLAVRRTTDNWQDAAVLPPYRRLVLDEAHHLEDTAAHHLGHQVTSFGVTRLMGRLERNGRGLIPSLLADLVRRDDLLSEASVELLRETVLPAVHDARTYAQSVFGYLSEPLNEKETYVLRLDDAFARHPVWDRGLGVTLDNFVNVLRRLREGVETVADRLELSTETDSRFQFLKELRGVIRRLEAVQDGLMLTLRPAPGTQVVRWIERRGSRPVTGLPFPVGLAAVPLELAPILKETLFDRVDTVVLTSATLTTGGGFSFLKGRLGLDLAPSRTKVEESLPSPFAFERQCLFGIATDLPDPRAEQDGFDRATANAVVDLAEASGGGMFVLFTSHAALRRAAQLLRNRVASRWPLLVQGDATRDRLLQRFREAGSAILLGTDSFWEGVDVPGRALRCLIIPKMPFKVPTEPLTAARLEQLADRGEDGFMSYLVPHAALKLKQGFGRLIRSRADRGVVALLDRRIVARKYGQVMLESLPPAARTIGPWQTIAQEAQAFFAAGGEDA